jgi:hypothetical protein
MPNAHPWLRLVAVYETRLEARAAAKVARDAGADPRHVHVGDDLDRVASIAGEMREEMSPNPEAPGSWLVAMARGLTLGVVVGALIGAVIALPFAAISFGGLSWWARIVLVAGVGAGCGAAVGGVVAGGFTPPRAETPLLAERGVTLEVPDRPEVEAAIAATAPRRVDVIDDTGRPVRRVKVQPREHILRTMRQHMAEESRRA